MSKLLSPGQYRTAIQICAMSAVAALMSGCSSDSTRFGDAFGNPFATGSTAKPQKISSLKRPTGTGRTPPVVASALPPHGTAVAAAAPFRSAPVAISHETTGSIASARNIPGSSFGGWSGQGGASVQVAQGDTGAVLAQRYGVPENVLLQVNGLHAAAEIRPGATIVVPVYNAVASAPGAAPRMAQAAPAPLVHPVSPRVAAIEPARPAAVRAVPVHVAKAEPPLARVARTEPVSPVHKGKVVAMAPVKAAAVQVHVAKVPAVAVAVTHPAPKLKPVAVAAVAKPVAAPVKSAPVKAAALRAPAKVAAPVKVAALPAPAKVAAAAPAAKPVPARVAASSAKPEQVAALETKKPVDETPTASVPASATAAATPATDGPEFRWPARGRIIQGFKGGAGGNDGINIAVPEGTQVKAAEGGVVAYAGSELKGYGNLVLIRHPNGYVTAYANNGEIDVKRGETVKRGQMIAKSGQSGNVSSPQLHFELRKGAQPVDPTSYLAGL